MVTLINQLASMSGTTAALQAQADGANQAAKKYMEDNELLKQVKADTIYYHSYLRHFISHLLDVNTHSEHFTSELHVHVLLVHVMRCISGSDGREGW